jgi:hypothetical protein
MDGERREGDVDVPIACVCVGLGGFNEYLMTRADTDLTNLSPDPTIT